MARHTTGKAVTVPREDREALWVELAIYLERSPAHLRDAWDLDEARVRALPRFARAELDYDVPVKTAQVASLFAHRGLLAYAEELRGRVNHWYPEAEPEHPRQRAIMECAIEHAKARCGLPHESDASFGRLLGLVRAHGPYGQSNAVFLHAGRAEILPFVQKGTHFWADALIAFMREAGPDAYRVLAVDLRVRMPLGEPLPSEDATRFYPFLGPDLVFSHQLLSPASRAHEHVAEAIAALSLSTPEPEGSLATPIRSTAAVLAIASGIDDEVRMGKALAALRGRALWLVTDALHFPKVAETLVRRWRALEPSPSPTERSVLEALAVFTLDDAKAAALLTEATKVVATASPDERAPALSALFRIAMVRKLPRAGYRIVTKLPKGLRRAPTMELARTFADSGDLGGMVEMLSKIDSVNDCLPEQTSPLALSVLRSLHDDA